MPLPVEGGKGWGGGQSQGVGQGRGARLVRLQDVGRPNRNSPIVDAFKEEVIKYDINEQDVILVPSIVI